VYWSLIVESHFYIVLPLLFWLTRGLSVRRTSTVLFLVLFFVPLVARQFMWPADVYVLPDFTTPLYADVWLKLSRFPCQLDYFAWGLVFAAVYVSLTAGGGGQLRPLSILGYVGMGLMVVTVIFWGSWTTQFDIRTHVPRWSVEISHFLPAVATMLMLFFVFDPGSLGARVLSMGWLRFTGIISFEWFLFHGPVVEWFKEHYSGPTHGSFTAYAWRTVLPVVITYIFAVLVYRYFSLPILNGVRDRLKSSPKARSKILGPRWPRFFLNRSNSTQCRGG
jgi:peptidoglycan/LPS O-acetylase OafA/YrhL